MYMTEATHEELPEGLRALKKGTKWTTKLLVKFSFEIEGSRQYAIVLQGEENKEKVAFVLRPLKTEYMEDDVDYYSVDGLGFYAPIKILSLDNIEKATKKHKEDWNAGIDRMFKIVDRLKFYFNDHSDLLVIDQLKQYMRTLGSRDAFDPTTAANIVSQFNFAGKGEGFIVLQSVLTDLSFQYWNEEDSHRVKNWWGNATYGTWLDSHTVNYMWGLVREMCESKKEMKKFDDIMSVWHHIYSTNPFNRDRWRELRTELFNYMNEAKQNLKGK